MTPGGTGPTRETAATLGIAAADDLEAFRTLFVERRTLEATGTDTPRQEQIRREMASLAPRVQRHLEALGSALVVLDDPASRGRGGRQPLPLTYLAAFGAREEYEPLADSLVGALETAVGRFRSGDGGVERFRRRRRRRASSRHRRATRALWWLLLAVSVLGFYVAGLQAFGDWGG